MVIHGESEDWTLNLDNLSRSYGDKKALIDVSLKWKEGVLGLIGPNGAGKSTLLKILCTIIRPDQGWAKIFGKDVVKESFEVRKQIGVLFENPIFHPNTRVYRSLVWVGKLRGLTPDGSKRQTLELLEYFGLQEASDNTIKELSAGMKQKYGLIYATIGNPSLILLDEPTSNLDPGVRNLYKSYVSRLVREHQCNFLISSHVLGELDSLCDEFVFLFNGKVAVSGKREALRKKIPSYRYRLITSQVEQLSSILNNEGIGIESTSVREIIITVPDANKLKLLDSQLQELGTFKDLEIIKLESEIESLYHHLSTKHEEKRGR